MNKVFSPLCVEVWAALFSDHPDQRFTSYLISGLHEGFRIGFNRDSKLVLAARQSTFSVRAEDSVGQDL